MKIGCLRVKSKFGIESGASLFFPDVVVLAVSVPEMFVWFVGDYCLVITY